jgi:hypothetical protein
MTTHTFKTGDVVHIAANCTDVWVSRYLIAAPAIVLSKQLIDHSGQEGRLQLEFIDERGFRRGSGPCLPEFLISAIDSVALAAKAAYEQRVIVEAAYEAKLTEERATIAREYGLDPKVAEEFYRARRSYEYDHGDDG